MPRNPAAAIGFAAAMSGPAAATDARRRSKFDLARALQRKRARWRVEVDAACAEFRQNHPSRLAAGRQLIRTEQMLPDPAAQQAWHAHPSCGVA